MPSFSKLVNSFLLFTGKKLTVLIDYAQMPDHVHIELFYYVLLSGVSSFGMQNFFKFESPTHSQVLSV